MVLVALSSLARGYFLRPAWSYLLVDLGFSGFTSGFSLFGTIPRSRWAFVIADWGYFGILSLPPSSKLLTILCTNVRISKL